jgi:hypothetical protein
MDFDSPGTTYIFPDVMQPPIELETVNPLPSRGWPGGVKGHVRSASHGVIGVSLLNPTLHPQPSSPSPAIGLLEAASGLSKGERSSQDVSSANPTVLKLPYTGIFKVSALLISFARRLVIPVILIKYFVHFIDKTFLVFPSCI